MKRANNTNVVHGENYYILRKVVQDQSIQNTTLLFSKNSKDRKADRKHKQKPHSRITLNKNHFLL